MKSNNNNNNNPWHLFGHECSHQNLRQAVVCNIRHRDRGQFFTCLLSALTFLIKYTLNTLEIKMHNCMQEILKIAKLLKKKLSVLKTLVHISELLRAPIYRLKKISSL